MATRILGPTGSKRRKRFLFGPVLLAAALVALFVAGAAKAVHDEAFQLDGDVSASTTTNIGGNPQNFDWDSFFNSSGAINPVLPDASRPGFTASGFVVDFNTTNNGTKYDTSDGSTYTQGSKDINNISSNWVCTAANNVTDKGDIQNAYAVAYTDPVTKEQKLYFALERNSNNGDANVAFWFLQSKADCTSGAWTGDHQDGDILIVSAFTKGGNVSTITAYRWNGGANGSLGTTPVAGGGDCRDPNQALGDPVCATANTAAITTPWLTDNNGKTTGLGHSLLTGEFFEGGINLTDTGLAGHCFNTFVGDTRSSQSLTATLYDYARRSLGECTSTTETTPTPAAGSSTEIPANAQVSSSDSAKVTVDGVPLFSGTVSFSLCGPLALTSAANCQSGGVSISTATLTDVASPKTVASDSVTLTKIGKYCWRAEYSGDSTRGVPASSDPSNATNQSECFRITPKTPSVPTCSGTFSGSTCTPDGAVNFGSSVRDNANLTGTANEPGTGGLGDGSINPTAGNGLAQGTITFKLYGPGSCTTLATGFPTAGLTASVNGDGVYGPVTFTPQAPGVYHWKASYGGDSPNTLSADTNANCTDTNEDVTVRQVTPILSTRQFVYPQDKAKITCSPAADCSTSGTGNLSGSVVFRLFDTLSNCQTHGSETVVGTNGLLYITDPALSVSGAAPQTKTTSNTSAAVTSGTTVYWRVTYTSSVNAQTDASPSNCTEQTTVSYSGDDSTITVP